MIVDRSDPDGLRAVIELENLTEKEVWTAFVAGQLAWCEFRGDNRDLVRYAIYRVEPKPDNRGAQLRPMRWGGPF